MEVDTCTRTTSKTRQVTTHRSTDTVVCLDLCNSSARELDVVCYWSVECLAVRYFRVQVAQVATEVERLSAEVAIHYERPCTGSEDRQSSGICRTACDPAKGTRTFASKEHILLRHGDRLICKPESMSDSLVCKSERRWSTKRIAYPASTGSPLKAKIDALPIPPLLESLFVFKKSKES